MGATPAVLDFALVEDDEEVDTKPNGKPVIDAQGRPPEKQGGRPITSQTKKQLRRRARRAAAISDEELEMLYKPLEEWDAEELARGRPRAKDGSFKGKKPKFIDAALHEQIVRRFEEVVRISMNENTVEALKFLGTVLNDEREDEKGRPVVSAATKLDAAKFLVEHVLGKPKQRVETDISVKLQAMLGVAMVNPSLEKPGGYELTQGFIEAESWEEEDDHGGGN